jgi:hypothetical protein
MTILTLIFVVIFSANVFDLAPGFYIKPQWYANLTLLCEGADKYNSINNSSHLYKSLGPLQFNTEIFAFTRMLFQSVLPFLVVLIFNSMIIYNFKKIKTAALAGNGGRAKSNSCVSVNSGLSDGKHNNSNRSTFRSSHHKRSNRNGHRNSTTKNIGNGNLEHCKDKQLGSNLIFANGSTRSPSCSPSPMHNYSAPNTPVTPTSLVSALNLADSDAHSECGQSMRMKASMSPTAPTTPTIGI